MIYRAAVIREQGVAFAVVNVRPQAIQSTPEATKVQIAFAPVFPGMPIVLVSHDATGFPVFHGRKDLVDFLSSVSLDRIAWREYSYGR